jgi:hypothetical protein
MNEKKEYHNTRLSSSLGDGDGWFGNPGMEPDNRAVLFGKPGRLFPTTSGMPRLFTWFLFVGIHPKRLLYI